MYATQITRGDGNPAQRGLGLAEVGGLLLSQVVTLYITAVYYVPRQAPSIILSWQNRRREAGVVDQLYEATLLGRGD